MSTEVIAIISGLTVLATGLLRLLEMALKRFMVRGKPGEEQMEGGFVATGLSEEERSMLREVHEFTKQNSEIIGRTDNDGVYLVYVPRSLGEVQKEVIEALTKVTAQQEKMTYILERLVNKLEK